MEVDPDSSPPENHHEKAVEAETGGPGQSSIGPVSITDNPASGAKLGSQRILTLTPAMLEWMRSSETEKACAFRNQIKLSLSKLEYLNGSHASLIFTAFEELVKDWEVIHLDLTRMEGFLARPGLEVADRRILKYCRQAIRNFRKVSFRVDAVTRMAIVVEYVSARARFLNNLMNGEYHQNQDVNADDDDEADDYSSDYPLTSQIQKVNREVMRRMSDWTTVLDRMLDAKGSYNM